MVLLGVGTGCSSDPTSSPLPPEDAAGETQPPAPADSFLRHPWGSAWAVPRCRRDGDGSGGFP
jgi:hypothetical protein